ncbi:hypothetical protein [Streptomyces sp. NPDC059009]|uniref:hypothetical protein n=1 Tax=Streptomyces sp. NPDC059009 TaxID=3346694 RepID=UPI0036B314DB
MLLDLWRLMELLHRSRHPADAKLTITQCPFHDPKAFEREARRIARLARLGIGKRP